MHYRLRHTLHLQQRSGSMSQKEVLLVLLPAIKSLALTRRSYSSTDQRLQ